MIYHTLFTVCQIPRFQQMVCRDCQILLHSPVNVDAEHVKVHAAIGAAAAASGAIAAFQIRNDRHRIAGLQQPTGVADLGDFARQLMTEHPWIRKERLSSAIGVKISAANPDSLDGDERFSRLWLRLFYFSYVEAVRLLTHDSLHRFPLLYARVGHKPAVHRYRNAGDKARHFLIRQPQQRSQ